MIQQNIHRLHSNEILVCITNYNKQMKYDKSCERIKSFNLYKSNQRYKHRLNNIYLTSKIEPVFTTYDNTPHFLMELSTEEYSLLKPYSIHVRGVSFMKTNSTSQRTMHTTFDSVIMGSKISNLHYGKKRLFM